MFIVRSPGLPPPVATALAAELDDDTSAAIDDELDDVTDDALLDDGAADELLLLAELGAELTLEELLELLAAEPEPFTRIVIVFSAMT